MYSIRKKILFVFAIFLAFLAPVFAQNTTTDKIVMTNGDEKIGKVTEIGDDLHKPAKLTTSDRSKLTSEFAGEDFGLKLIGCV